ncbi:MAG: hypothetical protein G01um101448_781 [Parcubacteria group bacterium Gr01-1014_48]|nr:MAG: hypothetical protein Greene041614_501 [Parcubacteria group bacterium Greene0416_14]TSC73395.1 MAG: hypothetical protein G01um101448_781 [Parcubacteria group bacterium Gr01-1014_48]TSD07822.1 MAG: hypothetical protein Greene07144_694 [Parcubacteria group bacterium Greene0714_4]
MLVIKRIVYIFLSIIIVPISFFANITWDWWTTLWEKRTWWSVPLFITLAPLYIICFLIGISLEWWVALADS